MPRQLYAVTITARITRTLYVTATDAETAQETAEELFNPADIDFNEYYSQETEGVEAVDTIPAHAKIAN